MTTAYTSLLGLALPVTGELSGTWGDTVNNYITSYLDASVAGALTVNADTTLTKTTGTSLGSTSSQYAIIIASGHVANITVTAPAASKTYVVINTSGTYTVKIRGAGPTTGVTVGVSENAIVAWNGSDFVKLSSSIGISSVAVASSNGLAGTSSGGSTPTLTLSTTVNGLVKGNGTALSAATAGTDYVAPGTATNFTAKQTFTGSTSTLGTKLLNAIEAVTVSATAATGTINYDLTTQSVVYYTTNASGNWTVNFRASSGTSLNTALAVGESVTAAFLVTQGSTAYYNNVIQVDGVSVTPKWQNGNTPISGNANGIDVYSYTIIKTASATFTVLASQTRFA
jgi:hypothetical protein